VERIRCRQFEATRARLTILLPLLLFAATSVATNQTKPGASGNATKSWSIRSQPVLLVNGAPMVFQVNPPTRLQSLSGRWLDHEVFFNFDASKKSWYGIAGVSLETHPGTYLLTLKATTSGGKEISFDKKLRVRSAKYPSIAVTVAKQFTEPSPEQLERINQEKTLKQDVFGRVEPEREWSGRFRPPVNARISDVFGTRRTFNGKVQSMHQGLDYSVPPGTPVSALNAGTVLLARPLFFEGDCVVLDHGQGLLTLYLHLSEIKVKEGEHVAAGQEIGLSGGTGRVTGPHLHVAVRWQGTYLNPATLLALKLP
jgi:murein DD-endopeptidase MepM/ murein hydrolase activator NlpD